MLENKGDASSRPKADVHQSSIDRLPASVQMIRFEFLRPVLGAYRYFPHSSFEKLPCGSTRCFRARSSSASG